MRENILALDVTEQIHKTREVTAAFFFLVDQNSDISDGDFYVDY